MNIFLWGQRNIYGGGIHFANFSDALKKVKMPIFIDLQTS